MRAPDRLCQIESTGAYGRCAEWVGPAGVDSDGLLRRFRPEDKVGLDRQRAGQTPERVRYNGAVGRRSRAMLRSLLLR